MGILVDFAIAETILDYGFLIRCFGNDQCTLPYRLLALLAWPLWMISFQGLPALASL